MSQFFSETTESKLIKRGKKGRITYVSKLTGRWQKIGTENVMLAQTKQRQWDEMARSSESGEISVDMTWEQWRDKYFKNFSELRSRITWIKLQLYVKRFEDIIKPTKLVGITADNVEDWMVERLKVVQPQTVETEIKYLSPIFNKAHKRGHIKVNPFDGIMEQMPRFVRPEKAPISVDDAEALFLAVAKREPQRLVLMRFFYETGMRIDEVLHQRIEDVDFSRRLLHVLPHKDSCECFQCKLAPEPGWDGKAGVPREVPLSTGLTADLLAIYQERKTGCIFPMASTTINGDHGIIKRNAKAAGLTLSISPHTFRHAFITDSEDAGMRRETCMKIVGHGKRESHDVYSHAAIAKLHAAFQKLMDWREEQRTKVKKTQAGQFEVIEAAG